MGLDNGIVVQFYGEIPVFPEKVILPFSLDSPYHFAYWRKFWGFRNEVTDLLGSESDEAETELTRGQLEGIIDILNAYSNRTYFNSYHESIWDFDEYLPTIMQTLTNLNFLLSIWETCVGMSVFWYDSY